MAWAYWLTALALLGLGYLTGFSIGPILLLIGMAMVVLGPVRLRPRIFWPPMAAVLAFIAGYLAVAPLICEAGADASGASTTTCASLFGIVRYQGTGVYNPSLLPGIQAGLIGAVLAAIVVAAITQRLHGRGESHR